MVMEYADRSKLSGALLSFRKAKLRAELEEIEDLIAELKAKKNGKKQSFRRPPGKAMR